MNTGFPQISPAPINELRMTIIGRDIASSPMQTSCRPDAIRAQMHSCVLAGSTMCIDAYKYMKRWTYNIGLVDDLRSTKCTLTSRKQDAGLLEPLTVNLSWSLVRKFLRNQGHVLSDISGYSVMMCGCCFIFQIFVCWHTDNGKGQSLHSD